MTGGYRKDFQPLKSEKQEKRKDFVNFLKQVKMLATAEDHIFPFSLYTYARTSATAA